MSGREWKKLLHEGRNLEMNIERKNSSCGRKTIVMLIYGLLSGVAKSLKKAGAACIMQRLSMPNLDVEELVARVAMSRDFPLLFIINS
jgi:hypothetical protein